MRKSLIFIIVGVVLLSFAFDAWSLTQVAKPIRLKFSAGFQLWGVSTHNAYDTSGKSIDTRFDTFFRRGRLNIDLNPESNFYNGSFTGRLGFSFDNLGKDPLTATLGKAQTADNLEFQVLDFYLMRQFHRAFTVVFGYFRPQVGREHITSSFNINSYDKGLTSTYVRDHLVGRSSGRETGLTVGGVFGKSWSQGIKVNYGFGFFDTNHEKIMGWSFSSTNWAPLLTGRIALEVGHPEFFKGYGITYNTDNIFGRKGITCAFNFAHQGKTNQTTTDTKYIGGFKSNNLLGCDVMFNYKLFNLDFEYDLLSRRFDEEFLSAHTDLIPNTSYANAVWHVRTGYVYSDMKKWVLEPMVMYSEFTGDSDAAVYRDGEQSVLDIGINWYLDGHKYKITAHYVMQDGTYPNYSLTNSKQHTGDYVGVGFQYMW